MLSSMKYKDFVWPNNPKTFEAELNRSLRSFKYPFSGFEVQDLGPQYRIFKGEGEFIGPDAYDSFRRLAASFSEGGSGWLEHPVWPPVKVYFSKLRMKEEPKCDYLSYSFEFIECSSDTSLTGYTEGSFDPSKSRYISALENDSFAAIAERCSVTQAALRLHNPQIASGATLEKGQLVRVS